jgi:hypothetical protein
MPLVSRPITKATGMVVDTGEKIDRPKAAALYAAGVRAIFRYVFFSEPRAGDLDAPELEILTGEGLIVCVVQHPRLPENNTLSIATGKADAQWAITNALAAGYDPASVGGPLSLALDMEGVRNPGPDSVAHAMTWTNIASIGVGGSGFSPVTYIGYASGLSGADCDEMLPEVEFWLDDGPYNLRPKVARGYALKQGAGSKIAGVDTDSNAVLKDGVIFGVAAA